MVFTFDKLALLRGQVLRVYFYENGGARNLVMTLGANAGIKNSIHRFGRNPNRS